MIPSGTNDNMTVAVLLGCTVLHKSFSQICQCYAFDIADTCLLVRYEVYNIVCYECQLHLEREVGLTLLFDMQVPLRPALALQPSLLLTGHCCRESPWCLLLLMEA